MKKAIPLNLFGFRSVRLQFLLAGLGLLLAGISARGTSVIPPSFDQLVNTSDYVIRGVVKSVNSEFRTTASGGRKIFTKVAIEVSEVLAGTPPAEVVLEFLGGQVGEAKMIVHGSPQLKVGDEDILFVSGNRTNLCPLNRMQHGRFSIARDATSKRPYVARANGVPLQSTAEIAVPMAEGSAAELQRKMVDTSSALSPDDFARKIKAAINPNYVDDATTR